MTFLLPQLFLLCLGSGLQIGRAQAPAFDGQQAFDHVTKVVALGARTAGSPQGRACGDYILEKLRALGLKVLEFPFQAETPLGPKNMRNIVAEIPGQKADLLLLAGHYDTKLFREFTFVGANDAGSSTGFLLELARVLAKQKGRFTYWITFFDGEEAFVEWNDRDSLYGSREMVHWLDRQDRLSQVKALILVDMVGSKNLRLKRESYSTPWLVDVIWNTAKELGLGDVFVSQSFSAYDDHYPFIRMGIAAADLLDLDDYPHWHRPGDTLDKLSPQSLDKVGRVLLKSLPRIETRLESGH